MTVKKALLLGDPRLRERAADVVDFSVLSEIVDDLRDTLTHHQEATGKGRGLAAPQLGYPVKVIYVQTPEFTQVLVNPKITWRSEEMFEVWDSCFSFEAAFFVKIPRHKRIKVEYQDERGDIHVDEFSDGFSELLQHEIDHLHGVMATDRLENLRDIVMRSEWDRRYRLQTN